MSDMLIFAPWFAVVVWAVIRVIRDDYSSDKSYDYSKINLSGKKIETSEGDSFDAER